MRILIIDNGTKHLGKLKELLPGDGVEVKPLFQKYPSSENYDLIILSGGSQMSVVAAPEAFKEEIELAKSAKCPLIGICEGCEIVAYAFGCTLEHFGPKEKGIKEIEILDKELSIQSPVKVYEAHQWAIKSLGKNLIGLAKSKFGYEIVKHKEKPIFGLQFHPEMFVDDTQGDEVFKKLLTLNDLQSHFS